MMKIVLVIGALTFGGAERVMTSLANYFAEKGDNVTLIAIKNKSSAYNLNNKINFINGVNGKNSLVEIYNLRKQIKKENPNIVLSFLTQINIATLIATIGLKVPVIISERNDPNKSPSQKHRKILRSIFYPLADGFVFQTEEARDYFSNKIKTKSVIIPNPIFIDVKPNEVENRKKEIVSIGRLVPQKNHDNIIKAFRKIEKKYPNYILTIYGEGSERNKLQNLINKFGLEEKILLKGEVSDIHNQIKDSEFFILASEFEGMPNALMESMALGLACISTDSPSGGPRFLIDNYENGILVPIGDVESISTALEYLINNQEARVNMSKKALKIYNKINPDDINKAWRTFMLEQNSEYNKSQIV